MFKFLIHGIYFQELKKYDRKYTYKELTSRFLPDGVDPCQKEVKLVIVDSHQKTDSTQVLRDIVRNVRICSR